MGGISVKVKAEGAVVHQYTLHPPCGKQTETAWQQLEICARLPRVKSPRSSGRWPEGGSSWHSWCGRKIWGWTKRGRKQGYIFLRLQEQQRNKDQGFSGQPTLNLELVSARRPTGNREQVLAKPQTGKQQPSLRERPPKVEAQGTTPVSVDGKPLARCW